MSEKGVIKQIIGAVIDVEFNKDQIPNIYDALVVSDNNLVMETQQQLGDGVVRTVAMGSTEGLKRGLEVSNTKAPISVPVGEATLGRIMNVLGDPIDMKGDVQTKERMPIHRKPPAYVDLADSNEILETGIKVIDLVCPFAKGGKVGLFGGAGVGKTVNMMELHHVYCFSNSGSTKQTNFSALCKRTDQVDNLNSSFKNFVRISKIHISRWFSVNRHSFFSLHVSFHVDWVTQYIHNSS